ncbi:hypothetical protein TGAMA5MH_03021 [Trichoderma gamsii]|uniref:Aflatoxin biosynthesis ketoreductase nor-1 n=1 Tax=Trichoderma gamsii TaxID=398673 RepID=A0A2K0TIH8_9HYPO|nr:hypothetical protein TGAMA5MH_03021 [Trichoderma gamsii]
MSSNTVYLITGTNRGIGKHIIASLVKRPCTTVIATVRDPKFVFTGITPHATSKLVTFALDDEVLEINYASLPSRVLEIVDHLDIVIANAGYSSGFKFIKETTADEIATDFQVNTIGVVKLFFATKELLTKSKAGDAGKKFVIASSNLASIADRPNIPSASYSISKTAVNQFAKMASIEFKHEGLKVGLLHPGWVKTSMGQALADVLNQKEPPLTIEESAQRVIKITDELNIETSGTFFNSDGSVIAW